jgi:hypothetical protein
MTNPTKLIINCETGVQEEIELTDAEVTQLEADQAAYAIEQAERDAAEAAKAVAKASAESKLAALGLTADEIAALTK